MHIQATLFPPPLQVLGKYNNYIFFVWLERNKVCFGFAANVPDVLFLALRNHNQNIQKLIGLFLKFRLAIFFPRETDQQNHCTVEKTRTALKLQPQISTVGNWLCLTLVKWKMKCWLTTKDYWENLSEKINKTAVMAVKRKYQKLCGKQQEN